MTEYVEIPVSFSRLTARNMKKGKKFQLSANALSGKSHYMMVHPALAKNVHRSIARKKGMRMSLSPEEISKTMEKNGGKISFQKTESATTTLPKKGTGKVNVGRAIKRAFKKVTDDYKEFRNDPKNATARKIIQEGAKQAIKAGIVTGATALGSTIGAPQLGAVAGVASEPLAKLAVEKIGLGMDTTGMNTMPQHYMLSRNYHTFLSPMHPAFSRGDGRYRSVQGQGLYVSPQDARRYS
jgi:hypothetical protein